MFAQDLSNYSFMLPWPLPTVLNVGWLDAEHPFAQGEVEHGIVDKLKWLASRHAVRKTRGFHQCPFCTFDGHLAGVPRQLGMAELWVPRPRGGFFAAPELVIHYIAVHNYLPPSQFLEAVEAIDPPAFSRDISAEQRALIEDESKHH